DLFHQALDALYEAARNHTVVDAGYLTYVKETMGMTQFSSLFVDSWRVQGLIRLGVRPNSLKETYVVQRRRCLYRSYLVHLHWPGRQRRSYSPGADPSRLRDLRG